MREVDTKVVEIAGDNDKISAFIKENEFFILKVASKTAKHYISKNDDEWSIALSAFSEAVNKYDYEKGSFFSFAELLIQRKLIDYYRNKNRHNLEIQVESFEEDVIIEYNDNNLKLEIEAITQVLENYGFSFMDLTECSPKAEKTKIACAKGIKYLIENPILINEMQKSKQLPGKILEKNVGIPRKILDRHRKYIIAATEILYGDYPYLSEYLACIRGEGIK